MLFYCQCSLLQLDELTDKRFTDDWEHFKVLIDKIKGAEDEPSSTDDVNLREP